MRAQRQNSCSIRCLERRSSASQPAAFVRSQNLEQEHSMSASPEVRPPVPPFTLDTARQKVRAAEDAWNTRDPQRVSLAYTPQSRWRNRAEFVTGRDEIVGLLQRKWTRELDYRLIKELWAFGGNR